MRRAVCCVTVLFLLTLAGAVAQAGAQARPAIRVDPAVVGPGEVVTVLGSGWPGRSKVQLLVGPARSEADPVATVQAGARGRFRKTIRLHPAATPGRYVFLACRRGCAVKASASFRIVAGLTGAKSFAGPPATRA